MIDQLTHQADRLAPRRRSARSWCGLALAGLVGTTTWAASALGGVQPPPPAPAGAQAPGAPQIIPPAQPPDVPPPPAPGAPGPLAVPAERAPADSEEANDLLLQYDEPTKVITVYAGRSKLLETRRPITRVVIANPSIADLQLLDGDQPNPKLIAIYGRLFGTTNLTIWDDRDVASTYLVRTTIDTVDLERRIRTLFPGSEVRVSHITGVNGNGQVLLEGQVPDSKTMAEVLQLVTATLLGNVPGAPMGASAASVSGAGGPGGAAPAGGATPTTSGSSMMMGGASQMMSTPAGLGAGTNLPAGTIVNRVVVPGPRQVMLHVKIAELNRTALRQIGVSWLDTRNQAILGSSIGAAGNVLATAGINQPLTQSQSIIPGAFTQGAPRAPTVFQPVASFFNAAGVASSTANSQLFGVFNAGEFNLFINALRNNQLAKILAEPNLMTLDGQPARFLAGGSFPFPVPQSTAVGGASVAVTIQFRDFGAILQFVPFILANDVIRLDVEPQFSELNPATGVTVLGTTVPGINQRSARTVVELREGQTLAIAGLLQTRTTGASVRVPGLGDLPIVGPLFSQNNITTVETELVVLVTPELVAPMEKNEVPPSPGDRVLQPNDYEFYFLGRIEGKTGHPFRATVAEFDPLQVMKHFQSENAWVVGPHGHAD